MLTKFETVANQDAEEHASKLIREGKTSESESWSGPDPEKENAYLDANGWDAYGSWFLGRNMDAEEETKARYSFPFTSDFENVDRKGLIAIRSRAAQNDDPSVFEAAGRLIDQYDDDREESARMSRKNVQRISFQRKPKRRGRYSIDQAKGSMTSVSLIQIGEAKGHGMFIDEESLESALDVLGENLPAYVTHEGAIESDRLLKEVGVFSGFFIEQGKLKAESFKALSSFREDEPERFRRLFDLAESMPDAFGLSLVFEPELVWIMEDGTELPIDKGSAKNAVRDLPSVRFKSIRSADFVDAPAANEGGLFSANSQTGEKPMDEETNIEDEKVVEFDEQATDQEVEEQTEQNEVDQIESLKAEIEELKATINGLNSQVEELTGKLSDANDENAKLSASVKGEEVLAEGDADVSDNSSQDIVAQFTEANGAKAQNIWRQNKDQIIASLRRD